MTATPFAYTAAGVGTCTRCRTPYAHDLAGVAGPTGPICPRCARRRAGTAALARTVATLPASHTRPAQPGLTTMAGLDEWVRLAPTWRRRRPNDWRAILADVIGHRPAGRAATPGPAYPGRRSAPL